jgi:hypothetical protein
VSRGHGSARSDPPVLSEGGSGGDGGEIDDEIRRTRDALVRDCGGDLRRLGDHLRAGEARWSAAGHEVLTFVGQTPLELPPIDWEKIDTEPEDEIMTEIRATSRKLMAEREGESCVVREEPPEKQGSRDWHRTRTRADQSRNITGRFCHTRLAIL